MKRITILLADDHKVVRTSFRKLVDVEPDLRHAKVWFDTFGGPDEDDVVVAALGEYRVRLQAAIGRQARAKRTPLLAFGPDFAIRAGERIDAVLREVEDGTDRSS